MGKFNEAFRFLATFDSVVAKKEWHSETFSICSCTTLCMYDLRKLHNFSHPLLAALHITSSMVKYFCGGRKKIPNWEDIYWCVVSNHNQLRRRRNRHNSCSHAIVNGEIKSTRLDIIMCIEWEWLILTLWNLSEHDYTRRAWKEMKVENVDGAATEKRSDEEIV